MPDRGKFNKSLTKHCVDDRLIDDVITVPYVKSDNSCQDNVNFYCAAMKKCDELLERDVVIDVMSEICCCKTGQILVKTKDFAKQHAQEPFEEKIKKLEHISQPWIIDDTHIGAYITGAHEAQCSCWCFKGCNPENDIMPISYCYCCAGFMKFHYERALGVKLKIEEMPSSFLSTGKRCSVIFEIVS